MNQKKDNEDDNDCARKASHDGLFLYLIICGGLRGSEASVVFRDGLCDLLAVKAERELVAGCLHVPSRRALAAVAIFKLAAAPNVFILAAPCPRCALGLEMILLCHKSAMRTQRAVGNVRSAAVAEETSWA